MPSSTEVLPGADVTVGRGKRGQHSPPTRAWDSPVPPQLPDSLSNMWNLRGTLPPFKSATAIKVTSIRTNGPVDISGLCGTTTVGDVKQLYARQQRLGARKTLSLRFYGRTLEDDATTLDDLKVTEGATFEAALRARTATDLEAMKKVTHVLMVDTSGAASAVQGVSAATTIAALKALIKAPETAQIYFSPAFTANFGAALADDKSLGSCGVLDGDVLYYSSGEEVIPGAGDAAKPPPKKK